MGSLRCVLQRWGWADTVLRVGVHLYGVRIWNSSGFPKKMRMRTQNDMEQKELRDPELSIAWFTIQNWSSVFSMLLLFACVRPFEGVKQRHARTPNFKPLGGG